ncbi:MAG: hypothetical protein WAW39_23735 [Prosthecobacter sp.]|uniref:hypothetical protein n=1 Tax=Prosthecobacter sp. TaxID=1965333 RepID=UPI003BB06440
MPTVAMAEQRCDASLFGKGPLTQFHPATVSGEKGTRAYFHDSGNDCPSSENCRRKAYVIAGDRLLVGTEADKWACAYFSGEKGSVTGWVRKGQLNFSQPNSHPNLASWLGDWKLGRNSFSVQHGEKPGSLTVDGIALWGEGPAPHTGSVEASAVPARNQVIIKDGPCQITLTLVDEWLIAADNHECGGMNVTFDGVYNRRRAP